MTTAVSPAPAVSEYTPEQLPPPVGDVIVNPGLDFHDTRRLLVPDRSLWTARALRDLTAEFVSTHTEALLDLVRFDDQRWWTRLGLTAGVELWLLSWLPGQATAPHDHGGASGSFAVLLGELREEYRYAPHRAQRARRVAGDAVGFNGGRAHQVTNVGDRRAASVHAYSPPLLPVHYYENLTDVPATGIREGEIS